MKKIRSLQTDASQTKGRWSVGGRSLVAAVLLALSACAPTPDADPADAPAEARAAQHEDGDAVASRSAALTAYANSTFYLVTRQDTRRCAYPMCGGSFTQRVNQSLTRCADGTMQRECRVLEFDYKALKLSAADEAKLVDRVQHGQALLLGEITKTAPIAGKTYDKLVVKEAWEARSGGLKVPTGGFARVRELPLECAACPTLRRELLNSTAIPSMLHRLVFDPAVFSAALVTEISGVLGKSDAGVLTAGQVATSGTQRVLNVAEVYTRFVGSGDPVGSLGDSCGTRGRPMTCASGLFCQREPAANCGRADAPGTCQPTPTICTRIYKPVCGCDGNTYGNECEAHAAEISVDHDGPC